MPQSTFEVWGQTEEEEVYFGEAPEQHKPKPEMPTRNYRLIESYLDLVHSFAIITVGIGFLLVIGAPILVGMGEWDMYVGIPTMLLGLGCVIAAFMQLVAIQFVRVFLDTEENTRLCHGTLIRIPEALEERGAVAG